MLMDHSQAIKQMAAERYLLNELDAGEREQFEEHVFDCQECALDLRAGAAFVDGAKAQLADIAATLPAATPARTRKTRSRESGWFLWMRPIFVAPAFAALLLVLGYQNLVTMPALVASANQPRLLASVPVHGATRGGDHLAITADRTRGIALPFDLYRQPGVPEYASYSFQLFDPQGKLVWTSSLAAVASPDGGDQRVSLEIPGASLHNGPYTVAVIAISPHGERTEIERQVLDVHVNE
jgi:hypothetical protein